MSELIALLNATGKSFVGVAVPMLIQSSVLIVALLVLNLLLRRRIKAVVRYWIWLLVLVKLMLPPSLAAPTSLAYWIGARLPDLPKQVGATALEMPRVESVDSLTERPSPTRTPRPVPPMDYAPARVEPISPARAETPTPAVVTAPAPAVTWQAIAFLTWLIVIVAMALLLVQRAFFVRGLVLQAEETTAPMRDLLERCRRRMGIRAPVQLRLTSMTTSPSVAGLVRPKILMPQRMLSSLDGGQLKSILLHELAHIKRGDLWISLLWSCPGKLVHVF
ncbi:MAG: M56 family metallopeptidase [Planctomycetota bacterium]|jgi:beta-lactamase regulating signal transducer with metallopeptidase domain